MAFSEALKAALRARAHFRCCLCEAIGIELHHIVPQSEGGGDDEDNAAPLCPNCHDTYGANPVKRKFIRQARDHWYGLVASRGHVLPQQLAEVALRLERTATRDDLAEATQSILSALQAIQLPASRPLSLAEGLEWLYEVTPARALVPVRERDFLHFFVWGGPLGDDELDALKHDFLRVFGEETVRRLCVHVVAAHGLGLITKGFTEDEINRLARLTIITAISFLGHHEIGFFDVKLGFQLGDDGELRTFAHPPSGSASA